MEQVAEKVFELINNKFNNPKINILDTHEKTTTNIEDGRIFSFEFIVGNNNYGNAVILISSENSVNMYYGDNIGKILDSDARDKKDSLTKHLKHIAQRYGFGFQLKNISRLKYDLAKLKKDVTESYKKIFEGYYGTSKTSYNPQGKAKIIIKHSKKLGEEDARFRNISALFIENADGERFKLPFKKLSGARAMARHVTEGGNPYDLFGQHISEMVKDINTLGGFLRSSKAYEHLEETEGLVETGRQHYDKMRKGLKQIAGKRGYHTYKENWEPSEITEADKDVDSIRSMFMEKSVSARIEEALPLLARLQELAEQEQGKWTKDEKGEPQWEGPLIKWPEEVDSRVTDYPEDEDELEESAAPSEEETWNKIKGWRPLALQGYARRIGMDREFYTGYSDSPDILRDEIMGFLYGEDWERTLLDKGVFNEGDVISTKFATKQAQKGKDKYKHNPEIASDIPMWDPIKKRNIPGGVDYPSHYVDRDTLEPYDHFEVKPTASGSGAHIMGITKDGYAVQTSTAPMQLATALVDAYNRGGFTDRDIQKVSLSDVFKEDNMSEIKEFEEWANNIVEGEDQIKILQQFFASDQPLGIDGLNAKENLTGALDDDELFDKLSLAANDDADADARPIVADWIGDNDIDLAHTLNLHGEYDNPAARDFPREDCGCELDADSEVKLNASVNKDLDKYKQSKKTKEFEMKDLNEYMDEVEGVSKTTVEEPKQVMESEEEAVDMKQLIERTNYLLRK